MLNILQKKIKKKQNFLVRTRKANLENRVA